MRDFPVVGGIERGYVGGIITESDGRLMLLIHSPGRAAEKVAVDMAMQEQIAGAITSRIFSAAWRLQNQGDVKTPASECK